MIKFHISFSFYFILAGYTGFLKEAMLLFMVILIHECGHIILIKISGSKLKKVTFTLVGGLIDYEKKTNSVIMEMLINLSGIFMNCLCILVISLFFKDCLYFDLLLKFNGLMICINLLPINPLDGYRFLKCIILFIYDEEYTECLSFYLSLIFIFLIFVFAFLFQLYGIFIIVVFLLYRTIKEYKKFKKTISYRNFQKLSFLK